MPTEKSSDAKGCHYLFLKELRERGEAHIAGWAVNSASKPHIETMRNLMAVMFDGAAPSVAGTQPTPTCLQCIQHLEQCAKCSGAAQGTPQVEEIKADTLFGIYCNGNPMNTPWMLSGIRLERCHFWDAWQKVADYVNRKHLVGAPAQPGPPCSKCAAGISHEWQFCDRGPAQGTPEPPKVEEVAKRILQTVNDASEAYMDSGDEPLTEEGETTAIEKSIAAILRPYFPPASQTPKLKAMTQADQKTYDPIAELEYIAKEIIGEDIALEDLSGRLEFAIQVLKEMKEYVATPASTARTDGAFKEGYKEGLKDAPLYAQAQSAHAAAKMETEEED